MKRYIAGVDRGQGTLFPEQLDDWVHEEDSPVRVVDVFVDECAVRDIGLLATPSVAIDVSKFKAVNNLDRNFTKASWRGAWRRSTRALPDISTERRSRSTIMMP
ncbi:hypothetical protein GOC69_12140 [Sinorhizobium medicae]|nr:hypothetical protein [Sinorhizobium medicae]MDX0475197.1 hypothetical protein [Sinorhizobium medicae]